MATVVRSYAGSAWALLSHRNQVYKCHEFQSWQKLNPFRTLLFEQVGIRKILSHSSNWIDKINNIQCWCETYFGTGVLIVLPYLLWEHTVRRFAWRPAYMMSRTKTSIRLLHPMLLAKSHWASEHTPDCLENTFYTFSSHLESDVVLGKSATFDDVHNPQANFKPNNGVEFKDGWIMKESKFTITRHARFSQFKYLCIQNFGF